MHRMLKVGVEGLNFGVHRMLRVGVEGFAFWGASNDGGVAF